MGCKCGKVVPIIEPVPVVIPDSTKPTTHSNDQDDDQLIHSLIHSQNNPSINALASADEHFVDIEIADPRAFNESFIRQRQQAMDNRSYQSTIKRWRPKSLRQLADAIKLLSNNQSVIDCHWIIFYWITYNIEYDTVSYFSGNYGDQSAETVFRSRKGVCAGYGNLYKHLCDQLNLPCEIVSGYSKGYGFDDHEGTLTKTDHAWNAVEIDQYWYLIESTWGAGHLTDDKIFKRQLNSYYFLPRPNEMIYHHLPASEKWQLLRKPIRMNQYIQMPKIHPEYFKLNLHLINPSHQGFVELLPNKAYALVLIRAPANVYLMAHLKLHDKKIEGGSHVMFDYKNQLYRCYFAPNSVGKYKISIFGKPDDKKEDKYSATVDLTLNVKQKPVNSISYPETWKAFFDLDLKIISPTNTHLIKVHHGMTHAEILIQTPDNVELLGELARADGEKIKGGHEIFYDRHKNLWRCKFAPNNDDIFNATIFAKKKSDSGSYKSAVVFRIDAKNIPTPTLSFPHTWQLFYDLDLKIEAPKNRAIAVWPYNASFCEIRMSAPDDVQLSGDIRFNDRIEENCTLAQFDTDKRQWQLLFAPQRTGLHELLVYAKRRSDVQTTSHVVVQYDLHVTKLRKAIRFPTLYDEFKSTKCRIYEPINGALKKGAIVPILCFIPGATEVRLQVDSNWIAAKGYEDPILKIDATVGTKDVTIYAKYDQGTKYNGLIKYSVA